MNLYIRAGKADADVGSLWMLFYTIQDWVRRYVWGLQRLYILLIIGSLACYASGLVYAADKPGRAFLGISFVTVESVREKLPEFGITEIPEYGLFVTKVASGSPAASAGLQVGDFIIKADGIRITDPVEIASIISKRSPGNRLKLSGIRDGTPFNVVAILAVAPSQENMLQKSLGNTSKIQIPDGWSLYVNRESSLVIQYPVGWKIQDRGGGSFVVYRPGFDAVVYVQPINEVEGSAASVVVGLDQRVPELFPQVSVAKPQTLSKLPEVAVAPIKYVNQGRAFLGTVMFFKHGEQGVLYAMAAQKSAWTEDKKIMARILRTFFYSGPTQASSKQLPKLPEMVAWQDPNEHAFSCPVPRGWTIQGGLMSHGPLDVRPELLVTSPDREILIRIGDAKIPTMSIPTLFGASMGFTEGKLYSPDGGLTKFLVWHYLPATVFLSEFYLPQSIGTASNIRTMDLPEIANQVQSVEARMFPGMIVRNDIGEARFDVQTEQGYRNGYAFTQTRLWGMPIQTTFGSEISGNWQMTRLWSYLASPDQEPIANALLSRMVSGFRINPQWLAQQSQLAGQVAQIVRRTNDEVQDILQRSYAERSEAMDRSFERWSRAQRDQVLIEDRRTGEHYEVPAGSNYYWRTGPGEFLGTDSPWPPDVPGHWVEQMETIP